MTVDHERAFALLEKMAFERVAGSEEEKRCARILSDEAASFGVQCRMEEFDIDDADVTRAEFEVLEPYRKAYTVTGYKRCLYTGDAGIEAEFLYVENALEANLAEAKDKIVLLNGRPVHDVYARLMKAGVKGIVTWSGDFTEDIEKSDLNECMLRPLVTDKFGAVAAVNMRPLDAMELVSRGAQKVRMTVVGENVTRVSQNVVAEIRGTDYPDEEIVLGGHYDSVRFSTGVFDNAAGSVVLMELLRYFAANPPKRTLKFVWFGAEEIGLVGSKRYVEAHNLDTTVFMINADVGGPILGYNKAYLTGDAASVAYFEGMMREAGYAFDVRQEIQSSDSIHFTDCGVPCLNINRAAAPGAGVMHNRHDTVLFLSAEAIGKILYPALLFAERVVNARFFPIKKLIPPEIREKVDKYLYKAK